MGERTFRVGMAGTFDVDNLGDQLFPLIAREELTRRLGAVELCCFSYAAKSAGEWPFPVVSVTELPRLTATLDTMVLGGGFLVRFDKHVAAGYGPPSAEIHHPTGFWLSPGLIALQHGVPVIWNAPGVNHGDLPPWSESLLTLALAHSAYLTARDEPSRTALERFAGGRSVEVVPDTAFGISRCLPERPSGELNRLRDAQGLAGPYIIVQGVGGLDACQRFLHRHADALRGYRFLVLPIGPINGDNDSFIAADLPGRARLDARPGPLLLAELIRHASAAIGPSFHLAIVALTAGVPVFTPADLTAGKFPGLAGLDGMHPLPVDPDTPVEWFLERLGKREVSPQIRALVERLGAHWDRVAEIVRTGTTGNGVAVARFLQSLPGLLESHAERGDAALAALARRRNAGDTLDAERARSAERIAELHRVLALARSEIATRDYRVQQLRDSTSWKITAPLRAVGDLLGRLRGR